jgi:hypothetical protein
MKKRLFAALAFVGALTAWSMNATAETTADFAFKNDSHKAIVEFYVVPHGRKFTGNWLTSPLAVGESAHLIFFNVTPGPLYDIAVVYANRSYTTWPLVDISNLSEFRVYLDDNGGPAMEMTQKNPTDDSWF